MKVFTWYIDPNGTHPKKKYHQLYAMLGWYNKIYTFTEYECHMVFYVTTVTFWMTLLMNK